MHSSLALRTGAAPLASSPSYRSGSGTAVRTSAGGVAAIFALESYDRQHRFAIYSLRVSNHLKTPLTCRIWIVSHDGAASPGYAETIVIAPFSQRQTDVPVWLDDCNSFSRALAEIAGDGVECIVEAAAPPADKLPALPSAVEAVASKRTAVAAIAVAVLTVAAAAIAMALPRISAFAVAPMAIAGTTVQAEYSASGAGRLAYTVTAPDGHRLAGGPLADRTGSIPVAIPASNDDGAYTLQLTMRGPLGTAKEMRVLNTMPKGRDAAAITDISVSPVVAKPGQAITVAYSATGNDGYVRLLGTDGTIWGQQKFSHSGKAAFTVPPVVDSREMRVLLRVTKGRSAAESSAGLVVAGASVTRAQAAPAKALPADNSDSAGASADGGANGTFAVVDPRVHSGAPVKVKIISPRNGMRISLTDTQSKEIMGVDVGADSETVTLNAPKVSLATRYTVVANFTDGFGEESVVEPITVVP